jgi:hypothetical protein
MRQTRLFRQCVHHKFTTPVGCLISRNEYPTGSHELKTEGYSWKRSPLIPMIPVVICRPCWNDFSNWNIELLYLGGKPIFSISNKKPRAGEQCSSNRISEIHGWSIFTFSPDVRVMSVRPTNGSRARPSTAPHAPSIFFFALRIGRPIMLVVSYWT